MKTKLQAFFSKRLFILAWLSLIALLLGQLGGLAVWQLELLSHYTPHIAIVLLSAGLCYPKQRHKIIRRGFFATSAVLVVWCFSPFSLYKPWRMFDAPTPRDSAFSMAYQNVQLGNKSPETLLKKLLQYQPDMLLLIEAGGQRWNNELAKLKTNYPVQCGNASDSVFAIQAFIADKATRCKLLSIANYPTLKITHSNGEIVYAIHPPPPINAYLARQQRQFLREFAALVRQQRGVTVIGDMNLSAFSPLYRDFVANTGLQRTTPNALPTWLPLGISIDQILTSHAPNKLSVTPLSWQGSDHRAFLIHLKGDSVYPSYN